MISDETKAKWHKKYDYIIGAAHDGYFLPTEWESDFIDNIAGKIDCLTFHQSKALNSIYNKVVTL